MLPRAFYLVFLGLILLVPATAGARTWILQPDGSGDVPTIEAAIDTFEGQDVIELMDGVYTGPGNRDLNNHEKSIVIKSHGGDPTACIIDLQGSATEFHHFMSFYGGG